MPDFPGIGIAIPNHNIRLRTGAANNVQHPTTAVGGGVGFRFIAPKDGNIDRFVVRDDGGSGGTVTASLYTLAANYNGPDALLGSTPSTTMTANADTLLTLSSPVAVTAGTGYMWIVETDTATNVSFARTGDTSMPVLGTVYSTTLNLDGTGDYTSNTSDNSNVPCIGCAVYDDDDVIGGVLIGSYFEQQGSVTERCGIRFRLPYQATLRGAWWGLEQDSTNKLKLYADSSLPNDAELIESESVHASLSGTSGLTGLYHPIPGDYRLEADTWYRLAYTTSNNGDHMVFQEFLDSGVTAVNDKIKEYVCSGIECYATAELTASTNTWTDYPQYLAQMALHLVNITDGASATIASTTFNRLR